MVRKVRVGKSWGRRKRKRSKYNVDNSKRGKAARTVDGITFASKAEMKRYLVLKDREEVGAIEELELQPRFRLIDGFDYRGEHIYPVNYTADFQYVQDGEVVIEEVKGRETRDFKLRKKMFLQKYGEDYWYKQVHSGDVLTAP